MTHARTIDRRARRLGGRLRLALGAVVGIGVAVVLAVVAVAPAQASFGIAAFDGQVAANAAGDAFTQAGGHPYSAGTTIAFNAHPDPGTFGMDVPDADVRTIEVALPPGLIGNPGAVPRCGRTQFFRTTYGGGTDCPVESQIGYAYIDLLQGVRLYSAVWNLEPSPGSPATFGFQFAGIRVLAEAAVRSGADYGITLRIPNINQGLQILDTGMVLWGVPASAVHDDPTLLGDERGRAAGLHRNARRSASGSECGQRRADAILVESDGVYGGGCGVVDGFDGDLLAGSGRDRACQL